MEGQGCVAGLLIVFLSILLKDLLIYLLWNQASSFILLLMIIIYTNLSPPFTFQVVSLFPVRSQSSSELRSPSI